MPGKIPPHSTEAERSVLGAALVSQEALSEVVEIVRPEDFYDNANRDIFDAMRDMFNESKPVDIVTVTDEMKKRKTLKAAGGSAYISELSSDAISTSNAAEYAKIVAEKAMLRQLIQTSDTIRERCYDSDGKSQDILDTAEDDILSIAATGQNRDYTAVKDIMFKDIEIISERSQNGDKFTGVPTGFKGIDQNMGGLQKSDLIVLAARPGMGKTAFALNVALNAAEKQDAKVLIFSMEMSKEQLGQRLISMRSNIDMSDISKGNLQGDKEWKEIILASERIGKLGINIDDTPNPTVYEIKNKCRRMLASQGLDLVIVDYLQLMVTQSDNVVHEVSQLTRMFKLMARELNCPIILISQLSKRPDQRENHRPQPADLRDSGSIEQDADIIMFLYRDDVYHEDSQKPGVCEVNIAKHRNGPTGTIDLTWVARYTKFADRSNRSE